MVEKNRVLPTFEITLPSFTMLSRMDSPCDGFRRGMGLARNGPRPPGRKVDPFSMRGAGRGRAAPRRSFMPRMADEPRRLVSSR
ncbi:MAG: hypothetical protein VB131_09795 [Burkholderia gladioli]